MPPKTVFPQYDPTLTSEQQFFADQKIFNEARNRDRAMQKHTRLIAARTQKSNKTRQRNRAIKESVAAMIEREKSEISQLDFLPHEYRNPGRRITISEYINLCRLYPQYQEIIEKLYIERQTIKLL